MKKVLSLPPKNQNAMKHLPFVFLALLSAILCAFPSCNKQEEYVQTLQEIQVIGDSNPQAALKVLESISKNIEQNGNKHSKMKCALLKVRLKDKAYVTATSTDTVSMLCAYFEKEGTKQELAEAYYYLASAYRDLQDYPQAVTAFAKVNDICNPETEEEAMLCSNAYSQLSYIFVKRNFHHDATECAIKELEIMKRFKIEDPTTYMDVATSYFLEEDTLHALVYGDSAYTMIRNTGSEQKDASIIAELMWMFAVDRQFEKADTCFKILQGIPENMRPMNYSFNMGSYYVAAGKKDSASIFYKEMYDNAKTPNETEESAYFLINDCIEKEDYQSAARYIKTYIAANDTVRKILQSEMAAQAHGEAIYRRNMEKERKAQEQNASLKQTLSSSILLFALAIVAGALFYVKRKKRAFKLLSEKDNQIRSFKKTMHSLVEREEEYKRLIAEKENEIAEKDKEITKYEQENEAKQQEIAHYKQVKAEMEKDCSALKEEISAKETELSQLHMDKNSMQKLIQMMRDSENIQENVERIRRAAAGGPEPTEREWGRFYQTIERLFPGFDAAVRSKLHRNSDSYIRTCYLMKIGLNNSEIMRLQKLPRQTVWNRVRRIQEDLGQEISEREIQP